MSICEPKASSSQERNNAPDLRRTVEDHPAVISLPELGATYYVLRYAGGGNHLSYTVNRITITALRPRIRYRMDNWPEGHDEIIWNLVRNPCWHLTRAAAAQQQCEILRKEINRLAPDLQSLLRATQELQEELEHVEQQLR